MVALACKYLRIRHLNNCPTGIATQHNVLRTKYFTGLPEMVINYFRFVAEEVREILASLGVRSLAEIIGRTEHLGVVRGETPRQRKLDLAPILSTGGLAADAPQFCLTDSNPPFDRGELAAVEGWVRVGQADRKSTRLNSSHLGISYAVFCLKKEQNC